MLCIYRPSADDTSQIVNLKEINRCTDIAVIFTMWCYAERGHATVCRLSVRPSVLSPLNQLGGLEERWLPCTVKDKNAEFDIVRFGISFLPSFFLHAGRPTIIPFSPLSLRIKPARESREHCKLPQQGPGQSPGRKRIWCTSSCEKATGGSHIKHSDEYVLQ